jgi:hypothetical protein
MSRIQPDVASDTLFGVALNCQGLLGLIACRLV